MVLAGVTHRRGCGVHRNEKRNLSSGQVQQGCSPPTDFDLFDLISQSLFPSHNTTLIFFFTLIARAAKAPAKKVAPKKVAKKVAKKVVKKAAPKKVVKKAAKKPAAKAAKKSKKWTLVSFQNELQSWSSVSWSIINTISILIRNNSSKLFLFSISI